MAVIKQNAVVVTKISLAKRIILWFYFTLTCQMEILTHFAVPDT